MVVTLAVVVDGRSEEGLQEGAKEVLSHVRPAWHQDSLTFKRYTAGVTNSLVGVWSEEDSEGTQVLVRVYGNNTHLFIDRQQEITTMKIVHKAGCGPEVYAAFINGLCYDFTPGVPLTITDVAREEVWRAVARQSARFHNIQVGGKNPPILFSKIRQFLALLPPAFTDISQHKRLEAMGCTKAALQVLTDELEAHLTPLACPVVFCHNDLALKNIIWRQDDSMTVSFIDYEYSAANYQPFDIANHFNEYSGVEERDFSLCPSEANQRAWLRSYLSELRGVEEEQVEDGEVEGWMGWVTKFSLASHLFWGVWAFLQACHSSIDFDYVEYGLHRLSEYRKIKEEVFGLEVVAPPPIISPDTVTNC